MSSNYLFVYGLLRKDANHQMSDFLSTGAQFISEAYFQGQLYLIEYYPGVMASENKADVVVGDLYQLNDLSILAELDRFEGIDEESKASEYRREIQKVRLLDGELANAWLYLYNWEVKPENKIHSGDFLEHRKSVK